MNNTNIYKDPKAPIALRVDDLLKIMTLPEKIGQMTQVENLSISPPEAAQYFLGSVLSGGGGNPKPNNPENWARMVHDYQQASQETRLGIPLIYGVDAVHGHNNMRGAVIFPHNIGLGASRDPNLAERIAQITAAEALATGVPWIFAPTVSVPQDIRWGRTYEGFSEKTDLVSRLGIAQLQGFQNVNGLPDLSHPSTVLGSVKHFVGDGGTTWGSSTTKNWIIDQGITDVDEATLRTVHMPPFIDAIQAGARNIMISHSSWRELRMHAHKYLLTDVLKGELGFTGFLVSDWQSIDFITPNYYDAVVLSINAGLDMIMVPYDGPRFIDHAVQAVENGDIPIARIDDAVGRILQVKFELGLFERPFGYPVNIEVVGCQEHRSAARAAVRKSLVLLKNNDCTLPLAKDAPLIFVAGQAADDIGLQCGGWTIDWQGGVGDITPGTTILAALKQAVSENTCIRYDALGDFEDESAIADVGIVVLSEPPYAEGDGDYEDLTLPEADITLLERVRSRCSKLVVILIAARPRIITGHLDDWDAFVAAWLPGTEGQGITDVLFGDYPFTGRLSYSWPRTMGQIPLGALVQSGERPLFPFGFGLS